MRYSPSQPSLQQYQTHNQPEFIHKQAQIKMEREGTFKQHEPPIKKVRRAGSVEPLERPDTASPLPDLPDDLKVKQVRHSCSLITLAEKYSGY